MEKETQCFRKCTRSPLLHPQQGQEAPASELNKFYTCMQTCETTQQPSIDKKQQENMTLEALAFTRKDLSAT